MKKKVRILIVGIYLAHSAEIQINPGGGKHMEITPHL